MAAATKKAGGRLDSATATESPRISIMRPRFLAGVDDLELPLEIQTVDIDWAGAAIEGELARSGPARSGSRGSGSIESRLARHLLGRLRERDTILGADLAADPAWEMLLKLFIAHEEDEQLSISSLCMGAPVPPAAALRWLSVMAAQGKVVRSCDADVSARPYVELEPHMVDKIRTYLKSWVG